MKRFYLILLLAAALCCIPVLSSAEGLDSLFEADALELEPYSWPEVRGEDLVIQDSLLGMLGGADPAMLLQGVQIVPISLSPSGTSGLFDADGSALTFYEGQYRFLIPSENRGVPDSNGNLQRLLSRPMRNWLGEEGVVYSPDGRYAAINNCQSVLKTMKLVADPVILDLASGELILTATYGNGIREAGSGAVTAGCFSADGRYYYYIVYGSAGNSRCTLFRTDLESGNTELCCSELDRTYYPELAELSDGSFWILLDSNNIRETGSIACMRPEGDGWQVSVLPNPAPLDTLYSNLLLGSSDTDTLVLLCRQPSGGTLSFKVVQPLGEPEGMERYLAVPRGTAEISEIPAEVLDRPETAETLQPILCARLSPDGNYLLLAALDPDSGHTVRMLLVRLSDLAAREVKGFNADPLRKGGNILRYMPLIEWNGDLIILATEQGPALYRFR